MKAISKFPSNLNLCKIIIELSYSLQNRESEVPLRVLLIYNKVRLDKAFSMEWVEHQKAFLQKTLTK